MALGNAPDPEQPPPCRAPDPEQSPPCMALDAAEPRQGASPSATAEPPASALQRSTARRVIRRAAAANAEPSPAPIGFPPPSTTPCNRHRTPATRGSNSTADYQLAERTAV